MTNRTGFFITLEGPEGCGKSTQSRLLSQYLSSIGRRVICTREPGGTRIGGIIRNIILDPDNKELCFQAEALLYAADRAQHVHEVILPALVSDIDVICDRFLDSNLAYQGKAGALGIGEIRKINELGVGNLIPDVTFLLDCPPEIGLSRKMKDNGSKDRIEQRDIAYHSSVREAYHRLAAAEPERFVVIDTVSSSALEVSSYICSVIAERLNRKQEGCL